MNDAQDAASYAWPALEPAAWLEEQMTFCRCGNLLTDRNMTRAKCGVNYLGAAA